MDVDHIGGDRITELNATEDRKEIATLHHDDERQVVESIRCRQQE